MVEVSFATIETHVLGDSATEKPCAWARLGWPRLWAATCTVNCAGSTPRTQILQLQSGHAAKNLW